MPENGDPLAVHLLRFLQVADTGFDIIDDAVVAQAGAARLLILDPIVIVKYVGRGGDIAGGRQPVHAVLGEFIQPADVAHDDHHRMRSLAIGCSHADAHRAAVDLDLIEPRHLFLLFISQKSVRVIFIRLTCSHPTPEV